MINDIIKKLRSQKGWSQAFLASRLNVSCKTIKNWESGKSAPSAENIPELARVFSVSTDDVLGVSSSKIIILDSLMPEDQRKLRAIFQAYISCCKM